MLRPGDKVCFNPDFFEGSKSELIAKYGTGEVTSEEYTDTHLHPPPPPRIPIRFRFINIKWECIEEECYEYADILCLVKEQKKRDIYALFNQEMNK